MTEKIIAVMIQVLRARSFMTHDLKDWFSKDLALFDAFLSERLESAFADSYGDLLNATRHAVLAGGKRLRAYLVIESCRLFSVSEASYPVAAALELIHCYSLVHDDLPAIDNDSTRRGRPTVHRLFGEATAILVGDALQSLAFSILASSDLAKIPAERRLNLIAELATASGINGMVGGQMLDIAPASPKTSQEDSLKRIRRCQSLKTGALISFACGTGALLAFEKDAGSSRKDAMKDYADALGYAFQIQDDLIDARGNSAQAGKTTQKDQKKETAVSALGFSGAQRLLNDVTCKASEALTPLGDAEAAPLRKVLAFNSQRAF